MRQDHWVIQQERLVTVPLDKVDCILGRYIGAITGRGVFLLAVDIEPRRWIATGSTQHVPQAILIEAKVVRQRRVGTQLPLANDTRCITSIAQDVAESGFRFGQQAKLGIVTHVVFACHQLDSRWRANWLRVAMLESHAFAGQFV